MSKLHSWEEVSRSHLRGQNAELVNRMVVPGGWMYVHTLMKFHPFRRDENCFSYPNQKPRFVAAE
jgi:hypothetical protein